MSPRVAEPDAEVPVPVRCGGCLATIGWTKRPAPLRTAIFCTPRCAAEPPTTERQVRHDRWAAMVGLGWTPLEIARFSGATHSLVYRAVARV